MDIPNPTANILPAVFIAVLIIGVRIGGAGGTWTPLDSSPKTEKALIIILNVV